MAKILTDIEMAEIIHNAVRDFSLIDDSDQYRHFLEDLGDLISNHFGGIRRSVHLPAGTLSWTVGFEVNDSVPGDGGVFQNYDKDVTWCNGVEN